MQRHKKTGKVYLSFLSCKNRYADTESKYFNQPFEEDTFNLVDDILLTKPAGVVSLATDFDEIDLDTYSPRGRKVIKPTTGFGDVVTEDLFNMVPL